MHLADEVILHIGFAKTGSTAIQKFMFDGKQRLLEQGVLWPGSEENHYHLRSIIADDPASLLQVSRMNLTGDEGLAFLERYKLALLNEVEETQPKRVIFSTEYLNGSSIRELRRLREFLSQIAQRTRIFAYVRDPWSMAISHAQQNLRDGLWAGRVSLNFYLEFVQALQLFEEAFEARAEVHLYGGDVVSDFIQWTQVGLNYVHPSRENIGIGLHTACVLARLNQAYPGFDRDGAYLNDRARGWMVECLLGAFEGEPPIEMSRRTAQMLASKVSEELQTLEARYFSGRSVFSECLDVAKLSDLPDDTLHIGRLDAETAARGLLVGMRALAERGIWYYDQARARSTATQ